MDQQQHEKLIDQLDRSYQAMPQWVKTATMHGMAAPRTNKHNGKPWQSFKELLEHASDQSLIVLRDDFDDNGDLLPVEA